MLVFALTRIPGMMPQNFSAAYALAFCGGLYFSRRMAWWLPLGTLFVTDILLNVFYYHVPPFNGYMLMTLAGFALIVAVGRFFKPRMSFFKLLGGGLLGAVIFYIVSNSASWYYELGYAKTLAGWIQALTTGLPGYPPTWEFFGKTLMSTGLFTGLFVAAMKINTTGESTEEQREAKPANGEAEEAAEEAKA